MIYQIIVKIRTVTDMVMITVMVTVMVTVMKAIKMGTQMETTPLTQGKIIKMRIQKILTRMKKTFLQTYHLKMVTKMEITKITEITKTKERARSSFTGSCPSLISFFLFVSALLYISLTMD